MILEGMTLAGFRSFEESTTIRFEEGTHYLVGVNRDDDKFTSNGAGKTSLAAAIAWALYGVLPTGAKKDGIINWFSEEANVELRFDLLTVRRKKAKGKSEVLSLLRIGQPDWIEGDLPSVQEELIKIIGLSSKLFFNSVWVDRENRVMQFMRAEPAQRLEILEELLDDSLYTKARKIAAVKRAELEAILSRLSIKLKTLVEQAIEQKKAILHSQAEYQKLAGRISLKRQQNATRMASLQSEITTLMAQTRGVSREAHAEMTAEVKRLEEELAETNRKIGAHRAVFTKGAPQEGAACSQCFTPITASVVGRMRKIQAQHTEACGEEESRSVSIKMQLLEAREKLSQNVRQVQNSKAVIQQIARLKEQLEAMEDDGDEEATAAAMFRKNIQDAQTRLGVLDGQTQEIRRKVLALQRRVPSYRMCEKIFGPQGIRNLLLDDVRAVLSHFTGHYAAQLLGEVMEISYPPSENRFEILLTNAIGIACDLALWSKGEVWRAHLVVLLAMRRTIQYLKKSALQLLILDDPFDAVDEAGARAIVELAESLPGDVGTVILTTPTIEPTMPEEKLIRIEKYQHASRLV